jgi:very-short-patch-repair endonuclease
MNQIEQMFYDALLKVSLEKMHYICYENGMTVSDYVKAGEGTVFCIEEIEVQKPIGIYKVDFFFKTDYAQYAMEIDGHDYHKTKEQRYRDYQRERFLYKEGITVFRFMASEIYVDAESCARWVLETIQQDVFKMAGFEIKVYERGLEVAKRQRDGGKQCQ